MSTTESAKAIRNELKAAGIKGRAVSVRCDKYSMGSTIYVTVKSAEVSLSQVKEIAEKHARVRRCSMTGEILSGGNMFVDVGYDHDLRKVVAERILALLPEDGAEVEVAGFQVRQTDRYEWTVDRDDWEVAVRAYGRDSAAMTVAVHLMDRGALAELDVAETAAAQPVSDTVPAPAPTDDPQEWLVTGFLGLEDEPVEPVNDTTEEDPQWWIISEEFLGVC